MNDGMKGDMKMIRDGRRRWEEGMGGDGRGWMGTYVDFEKVLTSHGRLCLFKSSAKR